MFSSEIRNIIIRLARRMINVKYSVKAKSSMYSVPAHIQNIFLANQKIVPKLEQYNLENKNFWGAGCVSLGNRIYMAPVDGKQILKFDVTSKTIQFIETGMQKQPASLLNKSFNYTGIGKYKNSLYVMPRSANSIMRISLSDERVEIISLKTQYTKEHHYSGVIVADGRLYQPPRDTNHILAINLNDYSVKRIPIGISKGRGIGRYRYSGIIYHPNGFIYMIPDYNERVIKFDPRDDSVSFIGPFLQESRLIGPTIGKDGNIYGFLMFSGGILKIDVNTNYVEILESHVVTGCCGTECALNGKLYGVPAYKNAWYQFDIDTQEIEKIGIPDKKCLDNLEFAAEAGAGAGAGADGGLYTVPCYGKSIYCLHFPYVIKPDEDMLNYMENGY